MVDIRWSRTRCFFSRSAGWWRARRAHRRRCGPWPGRAGSRAEGVGEPGVPPVARQHPLACGGVLFPARPSTPGLVDARHLHLRQRCHGDLVCGGAEGVHHGGPGQVQVTGGLDGGGGVAYPPPGGTAQPHGDRAPTGRCGICPVKDRARAAGLPAPPAASAPAELQPAPAVRQIAGPGRRGALHPGGEHPALSAGPCLLIGGDQMHPAGAVLQSLHSRDAKPSRSSSNIASLSKPVIFG